MKEHLEDSLLECTMQDLLRYDDYNNDGHLTLHEFYTAFRKPSFKSPFPSLSIYLYRALFLSLSLSPSLRPPHQDKTGSDQINLAQATQQSANPLPCSASQASLWASELC